MRVQTKHAVCPDQSHDEAGREEFLMSMREFLVSKMYAGLPEVFERTLKPAFEREHGRAPETAAEVRSAFRESDYLRGFGILNRATQELFWDTVGESVERQLPKLIEKARPGTGPKHGTLRLDPKLPLPKYYTSVDIHLQPGNFHTEIAADDVYAGALYDRGSFVFAFGGLGSLNSGFGDMRVAFLREEFPQFKPLRILDMGCGIGNTTVPLYNAFPDAEVHGIDISAPMLRYGHARAESLGKPIHFSQQSVVATDFEDASFDLVMSCLVTHEVPPQVVKGMYAECHRLLRPGGLMLQDGGAARLSKDPLQIFLTNWYHSQINEPFAAGSGKLDFFDTCVEAGFSRDHVFRKLMNTVYLEGQSGRFAVAYAMKT
jgi:ubiquinone/menaquinone biosynthesis C-methylase UbiE